MQKQNRKVKNVNMHDILRCKAEEEEFFNNDEEEEKECTVSDANSDEEPEKFFF